MKLPPLTIGKFTARVPLIQGGMSIRVSTSALAVPVAECGGIGVIGGSGIPCDELQEDIRKAKKATNGIIAVNIMYAMKNFYDLVIGSIEAGIDMIITGAGFSRDIFKIGKAHNTPIVMIVSSPAPGQTRRKTRGRGGDCRGQGGRRPSGHQIALCARSFRPSAR